MAPIPFYRIPGLLEAAALLGLALWLLFLDPKNRLSRAFALFMGVRGAMLAFISFYPWSGTFPLRVAVYPMIALPFVTLFFALVFFVWVVRPRWAQSGRLRTLVPLAILVPAVGLEILYFLDHPLFLASGMVLLFVPADALAGATVALILAWRYGAVQGRARGRSLHLVSLASVLPSLHVATFYLAGTSGTWGDPFAVWEDALFAVAWGACAVSVFLFARRIPGRPAGDLRRDGVRYLALATLALATGLTAGLYNRAALLGRVEPPPAPLDLHAVFAGLWGVLMAGLVIYALVRHKLFGIEVVVRRAISGGTIAGSFVAAYFVLSEASQALIETLFSGTPRLTDAAPYLGIVGAGLLVFALQPLQRLGTNLARAAVPEQKPIEQMSRSERLSFFRDNIDQALLDGRYGRQDRVRVDRLIQRLQLPPGQARQIEWEAAEILNYWGRLSSRPTPSEWPGRRGRIPPPTVGKAS